MAVPGLDCPGPVQPGTQHPEWQGSASHKWMDRNSGRDQMRRFVDTHCRNGVDSVARLGIGGYMTDTAGAAFENRLEGRRQVGNAVDGAPMRQREYEWKPSRKIVVPPHVIHREALECTKLTNLPPYVKRSAAKEKFLEGKGTVHPKLRLKKAAQFGHLGLDRDVRRVPFWVENDLHRGEWWDAGQLHAQYQPSGLLKYGCSKQKEDLRQETDYWAPRVVIEKGCKFVNPATAKNHAAYLSAMAKSCGGATAAPRKSTLTRVYSAPSIFSPEESVRQLSTWEQSMPRSASGA